MLLKLRVRMIMKIAVIREGKPIICFPLEVVVSEVVMVEREFLSHSRVGLGDQNICLWEEEVR